MEQFITGQLDAVGTMDEKQQILLDTTNFYSNALPNESRRRASCSHHQASGQTEGEPWLAEQGLGRATQANRPREYETASFEDHEWAVTRAARTHSVSFSDEDAGSRPPFGLMMCSRVSVMSPTLYACLAISISPITYTSSGFRSSLVILHTCKFTRRLPGGLWMTQPEPHVIRWTTDLCIAWPVSFPLSRDSLHSCTGKGDKPT